MSPQGRGWELAGGMAPRALLGSSKSAAPKQGPPPLAPTGQGGGRVEEGQKSERPCRAPREGEELSFAELLAEHPRSALNRRR